VFDRLEGIWALERVIEGQASMTGTAVFAPRPDGRLRYREEGRVRLLDGRSFDAHRAYLFEGRPDGFAVFFAEEPPRLFHHIALDPGAGNGVTWTGAAAHLCAADLYDSGYRFLADGRFIVRHAVRGPRKDYVTTTAFRRPAG